MRRAGSRPPGGHPNDGVDMSKELEPSEAIRHAKRWLTSIYSDEKIDNVGLEEVRWNEGNWEITLGFDRFSSYSGNSVHSIAAQFENPKRYYKVVIVTGDDNSVIEMRNREAA